MKKLNIDFKSKKFIIPASITAGVLVIALIVGIVLGVNAATADIPNFKIGYKTSDIDETVENKDEFTVGQAANLKTGDALQLYAISESENDSNTGVQPKDAVIEDDIKWEVTSDDVTEDSTTTETTTSAETTTDQSDEGSTAAASEKVVTVNDKGLVTAENAGTAVVRATIGSGSKTKTSTITINVELEGTEAVDQLAAKIEELPGLDALTAEDKSTVDELIREYNALTEEEKSSLANTDKLLAAQSQVDQLYEASTTTSTDESAPESNASSNSGSSSSSGSGSNGGNTGGSGNTGSASSGSSSGSSSSSGGNKNSGSSSSSSSSSSSGNKKPSSGSSGSSSGSSSSGSSSSKPSTTKPSTFAMSASEIKSYALEQIAKIDGTIYTPEFTKSNAGWNTPLVIYTDDSASEIKAGCDSYAKFNYNSTTKNGYNVYVEQTTDSWTGEKCLKVYFLYGQMGGPDEY